MVLKGLRSSRERRPLGMDGGGLGSYVLTRVTVNTNIAGALCRRSGAIGRGVKTSRRRLVLGRVWAVRYSLEQILEPNMRLP